MQIDIYAKTLSGNMGNGWADQNAVNKAYAKFLESSIIEALKKDYPEAKITVEIEPISNTAGYSQNPSINVGDCHIDMVWEVEKNIGYILQFIFDHSWQVWCDSNEAESFFENE